MSTRTSINKTELARLQAIEAMHSEMVEQLHDLANNENAVRAFIDKKTGLDISINRPLGKVINWNKEK